MTALALSSTELQSLINRGIVSIRPPEQMTIKAMQDKAWRDLNRERYRETRRLRYARNRDKIRAMAKKKYEQNKEKINARYREKYALKKQEQIKVEEVSC